MTRKAAVRELAVRRCGFVGVTRRASLLGLAAVRLVALRARLVTGRRRSMLFFVAIPASRALCARVRLVAIRARLVTTRRGRVLAPVTRLAPDFGRLRVMR
jgi:hypothetical protein